MCIPAALAAAKVLRADFRPLAGLTHLPCSQALLNHHAVDKFGLCKINSPHRERELRLVSVSESSPKSGMEFLPDTGDAFSDTRPSRQLVSFSKGFEFFERSDWSIDPEILESWFAWFVQTDRCWRAVLECVRRMCGGRPTKTDQEDVIEIVLETMVRHFRRSLDPDDRSNTLVNNIREAHADQAQLVEALVESVTPVADKTQKKTYSALKAAGALRVESPKDFVPGHRDQAHEESSPTVRVRGWKTASASPLGSNAGPCLEADVHHWICGEQYLIDLVPHMDMACRACGTRRTVAAANPDDFGPTDKKTSRPRRVDAIAYDHFILRHVAPAVETGEQNIVTEDTSARLWESWIGFLESRLLFAASEDEGELRLRAAILEYETSCVSGKASDGSRITRKTVAEQFEVEEKLLSRRRDRFAESFTWLWFLGRNLVETDAASVEHRLIAALADHEFQRESRGDAPAYEKFAKAHQVSVDTMKIKDSELRAEWHAQFQDKKNG